MSWWLSLFFQLFKTILSEEMWNVSGQIDAFVFEKLCSPTFKIEFFREEGLSFKVVMVIIVVIVVYNVLVGLPKVLLTNGVFIPFDFQTTCNSSVYSSNTTGVAYEKRV